MDSFSFRRTAPSLLPVLLALTGGSGLLRANNLLTATPSTATLTCNTASGPSGTATVTVKPVTALSGSTTIVVSVGSLTGGVVVTPPATQTLSTANQAAGLVYTIGLAGNCQNVTTGAPTFRFNAGANPDVTVTVNTTLVATASSLVTSPTALTVSCVKSGASYTPAAAQNVSVTSALTGGAAFTVDTQNNPPPAWLSVTPTTGGTASSTGVPFSLQAISPCNSLSAGQTSTFTLHLVDSPAPDKLLPVTLQVVAPTPLVASPSPATLTYTKGSGTAGFVQVNVTSPASPAPFFSVDTSTLPIWLTVDSINGTAPKSIRFSSTTVADTLAPGTYTASVHLKVSGYGDLIESISLLVTNTAPRLSVEEGTTRSLSWTIGQPLPTPVITAVSTDTPISYTITTGGTLAPVIASSQLNGLAYSFGTPINVSFNPLVFASAQPGSVLTGTVTLTWGSPASTIVVTFNISVLSPGATVSGLSPATVPTATSGTVFTVVLSGTGFVPSTSPAQKTVVGVVVNGAIIPDTNIATNVVNQSNIIMTITVPSVADTYLPFSPTGTGGTVTLGVCNPVNGSCSIPTGTATLSIGSNPIIQAVTSSASLIQVTPPAVQSIAPYDMLSIFGSNFCSSQNSGCSTSQVLYGTPNAATLSYPTSLSPDAVGASQRFLTVTFLQHGTSTVIGTAPLLFATNNQINLLVPGAVFASIGSEVDVVVNFGSGATPPHSAPYPVNVIATDPGLFTIGADGQGSAAALDANYALISSTNPGAMRSTATDSDTLQIYMTGLGSPDSIGDNSTAGTNYSWSADCASVTSYLTSFNSLTNNNLSSVDGTLIIPSPLNANRLVPCILSGGADVPTVTIGGVSANVKYAGWVPGTVAGLYQVNVQLPGTTGGPFTNIAGQAVNSITAPVQLPVVVTANNKASQAGVSLWVSPRLLVAAPSTLSGTVGIQWDTTSANAVAASEGTAPYHYAVSSGVLPSGLSLNAVSGAISGTPAAGTAGSYNVTVTATDSANVPVKGSASFTLTVAGGLFMTNTGTSPFNATFGTASGTLTTVTATGGAYPYTYTITSPATLPLGLAVSASGAISTTALTPAGTYQVTVTATDAANVTGTISFNVVVALHVARTNPVTVTHGNAGTITTVSATGNTGTVTYALDTTTSALSWVSLDPNTGILTVTSSSAAGTYPVTVTATDGTAAPGASSAATGTVTFNMVIN